MVTAGADAQRLPASGRFGHLALGGAAVVVFLGLHLITGRIDVGNGAGWDGVDYATMLRDGWSGGSVHTQLRPLIVWLNAPLYAVLQRPVETFDAMNVIYAGLFAMALSMLLQRYGATTKVRVVAILCITLTNHFRLFVFYPVLVDLGACLAITIALLLILDGPRWAAAVACIVAVLAREYAMILLLFGAHRDLRRGVAVWSTAATFAPAAIAWLMLRAIVMRTAEQQESATTIWVLLGNVQLLKDPLFVALFIYAVITGAGGLSMVVAAQPLRCWRLIAREPEWVSYTVPLLGLTALGAADLWRYLTPLLPVVAVFYASCSLDLRRLGWTVLAAAAIVLTVWTQEPLTRMNSVRYFTDWFPYYIGSARYPFALPAPSIWPQWGWRLLTVALAMYARLIYANRRRAELTT